MYKLSDYLGAVFLDIETTGILPIRSELTIIALYQQTDQKLATLYINDLHSAAETLRHLEEDADHYGYDCIEVFPLERFVERASQLTLVATFNGEHFDLPFIAHHLPKVRHSYAKWNHLDVYAQVALPLRDLGVLRTPNLKLKTLLRYLKVPRHPEVARMHGADAVRLWQQWRYLFDSSALTSLAIYALEDVRCTRLLFERLVELVQECPWPISVGG